MTSGIISARVISLLANQRSADCFISAITEAGLRYGIEILLAGPEVQAMKPRRANHPLQWTGPRKRCAWFQQSLRRPRPLNGLTFSLVTRELPQPEFALGDYDEVSINDCNRTPRRGFVRDIIWHYKDQRYNYYLMDDGKGVSKRYFAEDLTRIPAE
jgi:hypothetical protein